MDIQTPRVSERSGISLVWIIPLVTALVGGWLIFKTLSEQGPVVTVSFLTADGIEAGATRIKYKNVNIGVVDSMQFSEDFSHVILTTQFNKGTESFLRRNTQFWVVRPQLGIRGVSGLDTLVSGAYIEIEPGQGAPQFHFVGLEKPPVVLSEAVGKRIVLVADKLGSIDTGSPVYYKGILAGEVLGYELANDHRIVYIHAFIRDPFDQLVHDNSRFWNVSGMDVTFDADGLKVGMESIQSLLYGGIAFESPDSTGSSIQDDTDAQDLVYTLYDDYTRIADDVYTRKVRYVAYFNNSIRGLSIGAPVEFRGMQVGTVADYRLDYDDSSASFRVPVTLEIQLERINRSDPADAGADNIITTLIEKGLRARLQSGSLLTGMLFVELVSEPDLPAQFVSAQNVTLPEIPTVSMAGIEGITQSLDAIVAKLDTLDIAAIGRELLGTLQGTNKLANSNAIHASLENLESSMNSLRNILASLDNDSLPQTIAAARVVLQNLDVTTQLANDVLQPNSPLQYNLIQVTSELEETARSIRMLVETLERNPQSLLFGKETEGE